MSFKHDLNKRRMQQIDGSSNLLDIIIVNYNSTDHLLRCLGSIFAGLHGLPARILVQDNDSKDNVDRVSTMFPDVELSKNRRNMGFSRAVNQGLKKTAAPYVMILNPDTCLFEAFFAPLLDYMEKNPSVGFAGPRILDGDGSLQGSARAYPTPLTALFGRSSLLSKWFPNNALTRKNLLTNGSDGSSPMEVDWISGACMLIRRAAIRDVGLLDERFFIYWEDADWCRRSWRNGWKVVYFPQVSIIHYIGMSSEHLVFRSILEFHKSSYRLFSKYGNSSFRFLKPFVIAGFSLRISLLLASNGIGVLCRRRGGAVK